ncbi:unnamed protein product, partial [Iphiclides podalirius]
MEEDGKKKKVPDWAWSAHVQTHACDTYRVPQCSVAGRRPMEAGPAENQFGPVLDLNPQLTRSAPPSQNTFKEGGRPRAQHVQIPKHELERSVCFEMSGALASHSFLITPPTLGKNRFPAELACAAGIFEIYTCHRYRLRFRQKVLKKQVVHRMSSYIRHPEKTL